MWSSTHGERGPTAFANALGQDPIIRLDTPELVRTIRTRAAVSQEELARRLGVSFASVNAWERGRAEPRAVHRDRLDMMAAELGVRQSLSVLVIDVRADVCERVAALVGDVEPRASVTVAPTSTEGLLACGSVRPDLILLDLRMPGLDGLEVADALSRVGGLQDSVLVFVTGTAGSGRRHEAERVAAGVLTEPLTRDDVGRLLALVDDGAVRRVGDRAVAFSGEGVAS